MAHAIATSNNSLVFLYQSWSSRVWQSIVSGQRFQVWNTGGDEETSSIGATWQLFFRVKHVGKHKHRSMIDHRLPQGFVGCAGMAFGLQKSNATRISSVFI